MQTYINAIKNTTTTVELDNIVEAYLAEIGETENARGESYAETAARLGGDEILERAESRWFEIESTTLQGETTMKSVILGRNDEIIGLLNEEGLREVEVAGAIAADGSPVNRKTCRVSASKRNLERARRSDAGYATRHEHCGSVFYTLT